MVLDEKFSLEIPDYGEKKNGVKQYEVPVLHLVQILEVDENVSPIVKDFLLISKSGTSMSLWNHPRVGPHLQAAYTSFEVFKTWWDIFRLRRRKKMARSLCGTPSTSTVRTTRSTIPSLVQIPQRSTFESGAFQTSSSVGFHSHQHPRPSLGGYRQHSGRDLLEACAKDPTMTPHQRLCASALVAQYDAMDNANQRAHEANEIESQRGRESVYQFGQSINSILGVPRPPSLL